MRHLNSTYVDKYLYGRLDNELRWTYTPTKVVVPYTCEMSNMATTMNIVKIVSINYKL